MKVNLAALDSVKAANDGAKIEIFHPVSGEPLGLFIGIKGKDSDTFRRVVAAQNRRRLTKMTKGGGFKIDAVPQSEIDADALETLAECTTGFFDDKGAATAIVLPGDKEVSFSKENALLVYETLPWLREQVDTGIGDRANFLKS